MLSISVALTLLVSHPPIPEYESPVNAECPPSAAAELAGKIANISPHFLDAVIMVESRGRHDAAGDCREGKCHSFGMWQMNVGTCRGLYPRCRKKDLFDPHFSSVMAGLLWRHLLIKAGREHAAVAYNCGHRCRKNGKWYHHTKVTRGYFRRFNEIMEKQCTPDGC
jgi:transposase